MLSVQILFRTYQIPTCQITICQSDEHPDLQLVERINSPNTTLTNPLPNHSGACFILIYFNHPLLLTKSAFIANLT